MVNHIAEQLYKLAEEAARKKAAPSTDKERQAECIMSRMREAIAGLEDHKVTPHTLEMTLFYHWICISTQNHGFDQETFHRFASNMSGIMSDIVKMFRDFETQMPAGDPVEDVQEYNDAITAASEFLSSASPPGPQSRTEKKRQADVAVSTLADVIEECRATQIDSYMMESTFLGYWFRLHTLNNNLPEKFFQKIMRDWDTIMASFSAAIGEMAGPHRAEMSEDITDEHLLKAAKIDQAVLTIITAGGSERELFMGMAEHMPDFTFLMDTLPEGAITDLCAQFDGFYRYAKALESVAAGIASGEI